jgi:glucose-6-phosphate isomerase
MSNSPYLWERYQKYYWEIEEMPGFGLDISRMRFPEDLFGELRSKIETAFEEMDALEAGATANRDEGWQVGHYWLRDPALAPDDYGDRIKKMREKVHDFVAGVHKVKKGRIAPQRGGRFRHFLLIGIGGSALGPQFVADALGTADDKMTPCFLDNTDPDGMDRVLATIGKRLEKTLTIVISKSGSTRETRNGMLEAEAAYQRAGLTFARHAVAVTREGSELHELAKRKRWLKILPMWNWVGGRTSVTSAVGFLPALLQGIDAHALLAGAAEMDEATRNPDALNNPAMLLALMWHYAGNGRGEKAMVVLPYKDRLALFSRYLQQLVMESLGKELDRTKRIVNQGLTVYGNKGSTDQHAYMQQLREGRNDFFVTFIEVLKDRKGDPVAVEKIKPGRGASVPVTSGDYLSGFLQGMREALYENQRESITITVPEVNATNIGRLIALFERAVGFYASLINVNAYHQPGVEAGKEAAKAVLKLQAKAMRYLKKRSSHPFTAEELAAAIRQPRKVETLLRILRHLAANDHIHHEPGTTPFNGTYWL